MHVRQTLYQLCMVYPCARPSYITLSLALSCSVTLTQCLTLWSPFFILA